MTSTSPSRRRVLGAATLAAVGAGAFGAAFAPSAFAQGAWPSRPVPKPQRLWCQRRSLSKPSLLWSPTSPTASSNNCSIRSMR